MRWEGANAAHLVVWLRSELLMTFSSRGQISNCRLWLRHIYSIGSSGTVAATSANRVTAFEDRFLRSRDTSRAEAATRSFVQPPSARGRDRCGPSLQLPCQDSTSRYSTCVQIATKGHESDQSLWVDPVDRSMPFARQRPLGRTLHLAISRQRQCASFASEHPAVRISTPCRWGG